MSANEERLVIQRLRKSIGCPIRWEDRFNDESLCKDLRIYWLKLASNFETDGEMSYYSRRRVEYTLYEPELQAIEKNCPHWRSRATEAYDRKTGFLRSLRFASPADYHKHYPNPAWSREKIIEKTNGGDALFFKEVDVTVLNQLLLWSIAQRLLQVIEERSAHLYLRTPIEIGASLGTPTTLIRFDIDYDIPLAHGHPIIEKELPSKADVIERPHLAFSNDDYYDCDHDIDEPDDVIRTPRRDDPMP